MKARVKVTGYIVDVELSHYIGDVAWYITKCHVSYPENELEFIDKPQDYWTCLEHQYAGMAMQGMLNNSYLAGEFRKDPNNGIKDMSKIITKAAAVYAHALVEKYKKEE